MYIKKRHQNLHATLKLMIDSILSQWKKSIITDQIVTKSHDQEIEVVTNPDRIKLLIHNHMYKWTKNKSTLDLPKISNEWEREFAPKSFISEDEMNNIIKTISTDELESALQDLLTKKVPSPLGITNEMLKKTGPQTKRYFLHLLNKILITETIPVDWVTSYISSPKTKRLERLTGPRMTNNTNRNLL